MTRVFDGLRRAFHDPTARIYSAVETGVFALIAISVLILIVELFPRLPDDARAVLDVVDRVILTLFALELIARVATVKPRAPSLFPHSPSERLWAEVRARLIYLTQPIVLIDLITVLTLFSGLRALRAVRLLRLLRTLKLFRYADPLRVSTAAVRDNSLLYVIALIALAAAVGIGGLTMYFAEFGQPDSQIENLGDAVWWALVTLTTVGYGDITPSTTIGRVIASFLMIAGMFTLATFAGVVGHTLLTNLMHIRKEQLRMSTRIGHIVICGYDSGALPLIEALEREFPTGDEPMVIFAPTQPPTDMPDRFTWVPGDPTKHSELDKVRMAYARTVIVMGRDEGRGPQETDAVTLLTLFTIGAYMRHKEAEGLRRRIPLQVVAEILDPENVEHARASGADEVVKTAQLGLSVLAHTVAMPGTGTALGIVIGHQAQRLFVGSIPEDLDPMPATFCELVPVMKNQKDVLVMGVQAPDTEAVELNPAADRPIFRETRVLYLATDPLPGDRAAQRWKLED